MSQTAVSSEEIAGLPEVQGAILEGVRWAAEEMGAAGARAIAVASAERGEGRTSLAIAMAAVQADDYRRRTLLLDLDLERGGLTEALGLGSLPGVSELVRDGGALGAAVHPVAERVWAVPRGERAGAETWTLRRFAESGSLNALLEHVEVVIADLPPTLESSAGRSALGAGFDAAVLAVWAGRTPAARARLAAEALPVEPVVVLNGVETRIPRWIRRLLALDAPA